MPRKEDRLHGRQLCDEDVDDEPDEHRDADIAAALCDERGVGQRDGGATRCQGPDELVLRNDGLEEDEERFLDDDHADGGKECALDDLVPLLLLKHEADGRDQPEQDRRVPEDVVNDEIHLEPPLFSMLTDVLS